MPGASGSAHWSGGNHQFNNQYHSLPGNSGAGVPLGAAGGGALAGGLKRDADGGNCNLNNSRKEKRQYKKRKHKTPQRDKPYASPGE